MEDFLKSSTKDNTKHKEDLSKYIYDLFTKPIYADLYYAWVRDGKEPVSAEGAKFFRDELLHRKNKDLRHFYFKSMRASMYFLQTFIGNIKVGPILKVDLSDNLITDVCMYNIKSLISSKGVQDLNLASNMISTEGLKIVQNEIMESKYLKVLNFGVAEDSFRRNNFSGEGGLILARILMNNQSLETLILEENELGDESGEKIGVSLSQNLNLKNLVIANNKIKNRGARAIITNSRNLFSINLSRNDISPEICEKLFELMKSSHNLKEIVWDGNQIGIKGINYIVNGMLYSNSPLASESGKTGKKQKLSEKLLSHEGGISPEYTIQSRSNKFCQLKKLSLKNASLGQLGIQKLAEGLKDNTSLEILDIGNNSIGYNSFAQICESLKTNRIRILRAHNNLLGDDSMKYFADKIINPKPEDLDPSHPTGSALVCFDFSCCKIYDQGLIYLIDALANNQKIKSINLSGNYFSFEIDFVLLKYLEKNTYLTSLNLKKNRFSYQCMQKVNKIIQRNIKIQQDKSTNKLLSQYYAVKYESSKLAKLKKNLKDAENEQDILKTHKIEKKANLDVFKSDCKKKMEIAKREIQKNNEDIVKKKALLESLKEKYEELKTTNKQKLDEMQNNYDELVAKEEKIDKNISEMQIKLDNHDVEINEKLKALANQLEELKETDAKKKEELKELNRIKNDKEDELDEKLKQLKGEQK